MKTWKGELRARQRGVALFASVALHGALLPAVLWPVVARWDERSGDRPFDVRLIDDGALKAKAETRAEPMPDKPVDDTPSRAAASRCDGRTYTGIGLRAWVNGTIVEVAAGGPADKAGLRAGDILLNVDETAPDEHRPGTPITLRYLRDEREMPPVVAVIEAICSEPAR